MLKRERSDKDDNQISKRLAIMGDSCRSGVSALKMNRNQYDPGIQAEISKAYHIYGILLSTLESGSTDEGSLAAFKQLIEFGKGIMTWDVHGSWVAT